MGLTECVNILSRQWPNIEAIFIGKYKDGANIMKLLFLVLTILLLTVGFALIGSIVIDVANFLCVCQN